MLSFDASDRSYPVCSDGRCLPLGCLCEIRLISCVCGGSIFKYSLTGSLLRSLCLSAHDQKPTGVAAGKGVSAPNIFIPYVRSSFCRIEIVYTDENTWARRKVQSTVLQHLKGLNFQSEIAGQEHARFWFARNRTQHERAKIRAILQTQSLCLKFLDETLVEKDWRGKVWAAGTQVLFHVDRDTRPVETLMLVDARGNETGWFLNVAQLVARLGATQEAVLAFFDAKPE